MAIPVPPPNSSTPVVSKRGFHLPARQSYAVHTSAKSHTEALYAYGELCLVILMWQLQDFEADRVERCSRCQTTVGTGDAANDALIFDHFKQAPETHCPTCFRTTYEGGWKAQLVRPVTFEYSEEKWDQNRQGYVSNLAGRIQTTNDFYMADGDYIFRADGTRWQVRGGSTDRIHDGFGHPSRADSNLGYSYSNVVREEDGATSFRIPPLTRTELTDLLERTEAHFPGDRTAMDQVRGPILVEHNNHTPLDRRPTDGIVGPPHGRPTP